VTDSADENSNICIATSSQLLSTDSFLLRYQFDDRTNSMAADAPKTSIADLERLIERKRSELQTLLEKREQLQKTLDELDARIQDAASLDGPTARARRRKTRVKTRPRCAQSCWRFFVKTKRGCHLPIWRKKSSRRVTGARAGIFRTCCINVFTTVPTSFVTRRPSSID
jgi:hypothetical protein